MFKYCNEYVSESERKILQRRSQNEAVPPEKTKIFRWCFISISTIRKQAERTVGLT